MEPDWRQSGNIFDNPGIHRGPLIREVMNSFSNLSFYHPTTMPSAQSSSSVSEKVGPVNQQPPAALPMSTDPNEQGKRAMRLRGGCLVRHSNAVPISVTYIFSRNVMSPVGAAMLGAAFEEESAAMRHRGLFLCVIPQFQLLIRILARLPFRVAVESSARL